MKSKIWAIAGRFIQFCICEENRKISVMILIALIFGAGVQFADYLSCKNNYIYNEKGNLVAIIRNNTEEAETVPLRITISEKGELLSKDVILNLNGKNSDMNENRSESEQSYDLSTRIDEIISKVSDSTDRILYLPLRDENGEVIKWDKQRNLSFLLMILVFPMSMAVLYESRKSAEKKAIHERHDSIRRGLPRFCNQLLLLLNSGIVFDDAFNRITEIYRDSTKPDFFQMMIIDIRNQCMNTSDSPVSLLVRKSKEYKIRELARITALLESGQKKGTNLASSLELECNLLWNERKKDAEERGRAAEVKLSFPLAVLLLAVIVITAAPAMLEM